MSTETLREYGVHAVSISAIGYAALASSTHDLWVVGGAGVLSLAFEALRRFRPSRTVGAPDTEVPAPDVVASVANRGFSTIESLANILQGSASLPDADTASESTSNTDGEHDSVVQDAFKWKIQGWLAGVQDILTLFLMSYTEPISREDLLALLRKAEARHEETAQQHPADSQQRYFSTGYAFAYNRTATLIDPDADVSVGHAGRPP